jgi:hypothetical protein
LTVLFFSPRSPPAGTVHPAFLAVQPSISTVPRIVLNQSLILCYSFLVFASSIAPGPFTPVSAALEHPGAPTIPRSIPLLFMLLRTLLHSTKTQPLCFQSIPHSLPKTPGGGGLHLFPTLLFANPCALCVSALFFPARSSTGRGTLGHCPPSHRQCYHLERT